MAAPSAAAAGAPAPVFRAPWACGVAWHASTYPGHIGMGVDFNDLAGGTDDGAPVLASAPGTATVGWNNRYGNYVDIDHGRGWLTRYAHLAAPPVLVDRNEGRAGVQVYGGDVIGAVGSTGNSTAPHLHYEQRLFGAGQAVAFEGVPIPVGTRYHPAFDPLVTSTNCATGTAAPIGWLDFAFPYDSPDGAGLFVSGWTLDEDTPSEPATVHVYFGSRFLGELSSGLERPDVVAAVPGAGRRTGFAGLLPLPLGVTIGVTADVVCAYGLNTGPGDHGRLEGCRPVDLTESRSPLGWLDHVTVTGEGLFVSGWAFDEDTPDRPTSVHLYLDATFLGEVTTGAPRPDVVAAVAGAGPRAGFAAVVPLAGRTAGTVCAWALNTGPGDHRRLPGCRVVGV